jgi:dephospho-CoA kinase
MLIIGLTGNIASGKSEVARRLAARGATVIDSDRLAREVVEVGTPAYAEIVGRWGRGILLPDESIDRAALRAIVFRDAVQREALDAIVHPRVQERRSQALAAARERGDRIVVCDIPLLFERGLEHEFDRVIFVDAPAPIRLERLVRSRGLEADEARRMIAAQMPAGRKRAGAHFIIDNRGSLAELDQRVDEIWAALTGG